MLTKGNFKFSISHSKLSLPLCPCPSPLIPSWVFVSSPTCTSDSLALLRILSAWTVQIPKTCLSQEEECHQARTTFRPRLFFIWIWKSTSCLEHSGYCQLHNSEYPIGSGDICNTTTVFIYHKLTQESVILFICAHSTYYAQLWMAATNRQQAFVSWEVTLITLKISGCIHIEGNLPSNKHIHLLLFLLSRHSTRTYSSEQGLDGLRLPWEPFPDSNWLDC